MELYGIKGLKTMEISTSRHGEIVAKKSIGLT
jgi:hypothetical protein